MSSTCKTYAVPGPAGGSGAPGADGVDGINAFTTVTTGFVMPAEGNVVVVAVANSEWLSIGQAVYVSNCGTMIVNARPTTTSVTLQNPENTASGLYPDNVAPTTPVAAGNTVSAAGIQGPTGAAAAGGLLAANNLSDLVSAVTARTNLGLGTAATQPVGTFLQAANNLSDVANVATSRSNLGLDDMAQQNSNNVSITGGNATLSSMDAGLVISTSIISVQGELRVAESSQVLNASTTILPTVAQWLVEGNGAPVTMTSTPTISATHQGSLVYLRGNSAVNTVTLQDDATLAGSALRLGATTRVLTNKSTLVLLWNGSLGGWQEVSFTNVL